MASAAAPGRPELARASSSEDSWGRAVALVSEAINADNAGDVPRAHELYTQALHLFVPLIRTLPEGDKRNHLIQTVQGYMERAEALKEALRRSGAGAGAAAAGAGPRPASEEEDSIFTRMGSWLFGPPKAAAVGGAGGGSASGPAGDATSVAAARAHAAAGVRGRAEAAAASARASGAGSAAAAARPAAPPPAPARAPVRGPGSRPVVPVARGSGLPPPSARPTLAAGGAGAGTGAAAGGAAAAAGAAAGGAAGAAVTAAIAAADQKYEEMILSDVLDKSPGTRWEDIAGLDFAKQTLLESVILPTLRPDIFKGLRAPPKGVLLFGPPGTGKTMLARAVATESGATFFNISASSLTSKWMGEGEKLVRALFALARRAQPSVVFIDEIDSVLSARGEGENEASRRLKTEFMVQLDGAASSPEDRVLVMGATNRPQELDDAVIRRMVKRIYIPLPDAKARGALLKHTLGKAGVRSALSERDVRRVVERTEGYSGSDLTALCREAALGPVRELGLRIASIAESDVRPMTFADFEAAMRVIRPSVPAAALAGYVKWNRDFGSSGGL